MEEYLRNMKNLRTQMNHLEEEAASISVEEQRQKTALQAVERDLESVRMETKRLNDEADDMTKVKDWVCSQILEKQKKIFSLETESTTLSQTLELLQKERMVFQEKLKEERGYYEKIREELNFKLQDQEEWVNLQKLNMTTDAVSSELKEMERKTLEEEHRVLLSDKAGEVEYLQSLQAQVEQLLDIAEEVKCQCGKEYRVELRDYAFCGESGAV